METKSDWARFWQETAFGVIDRATAENVTAPRGSLVDWNVSGGIGEVLIVAGVVAAAVYLLMR